MKKIVLTGICLSLVASLALAQQPGRAYRDIFFAESQGVVAEKIRADEVFTDIFGEPIGAITGPSETGDFLSWNPRIYTRVGQFEYRVFFEFYDDKLYRVRFETEPVSVRLFDSDVIPRQANLVATINLARGSADTVRGVPWQNVPPQRIAWSHVWDTSAEGVAHYVGVGEADYGYLATLWVEWTWLRQFKEQAERDADRERPRGTADDF